MKKGSNIRLSEVRSPILSQLNLHHSGAAKPSCRANLECCVKRLGECIHADLMIDCHQDMWVHVSLAFEEAEEVISAMCSFVRS